MRKILFRILIVVITIIIFILISEISLGRLAKAGKVKMMTSQQICDILKAFEEKGRAIPNGIIHPYFGHIYTPNHSFLQGTILKSNSEGFIDDEFPVEHKKDLVVIGLIGGSAAMSWGVEKKEDKINCELQRLLNDEAKQAGSAKRYRVLNMGLGSFNQYQASQVFFYYAGILDGVIVYSGHNEITHGAILIDRDVPARYPLVDMLPALEMDSPLKIRIYIEKSKLHKIARHIDERPYLLSSNIVNFFSTRFIRKIELEIDALNSELKIEADRYSLKMPHVRNLLPVKLPKYNAKQLFFQDDPESIDIQNKVMRVFVPLVYTDPIIDAYAVARMRGIHFMNVIQPMMETVERKMLPEDLVNTRAPSVYERTGIHVLRKEAARMRQYGIETFDFNRGSWFKDVPEAVFIDPVHLTARGNKIVARCLFDRIKSKWFSQE